MNFKQKLVYMALGCLFTLIGYTLATLNTNVTAQTAPSNATFDKITCRQLVITYEEGNVKTSLLPGSLFIKGPQRTVVIGGLMGVQVSEMDGKSSATLTTSSSGGFIAVTDKNGTAVSGMSVSEKGGGLIALRDQHVKSGIELFFNDDGGSIAIFNKGKQNVLQAGVGNRGGGVIHTTDKNGYHTGRLPN